MTRDEARDHIFENYMRSLKDTPFSLDDAKLLPEAGACGVCPKNTDNCAEQFDAADQSNFRKKKVCCDTACFKRKLDAHRAQQVAQAKKDGKTVLVEGEAGRVFPRHQPAGSMSYDSPYIELAKVPQPFLLKAEVKVKQTWAELIEKAEKKTKMTVPRVMITDQAGVLRECALVNLAKECIEKSGEPIFEKPGAERGISQRVKPVKVSAKEKAAQKAEAAKKKAVVAKMGADLKTVLARLKDTRDVNHDLVHVLAGVIMTNTTLQPMVQRAGEEMGLKPVPLNGAAAVKLSVVDALRLSLAMMVMTFTQHSIENSAEPPPMLQALLGAPAPAPSAAKPKRGGAVAKAVAAVKGSAKQKGKK